LLKLYLKSIIPQVPWSRSCYPNANLETAQGISSGITDLQNMLQGTPGASKAMEEHFILGCPTMRDSAARKKWTQKAAEQTEDGEHKADSDKVAQLRTKAITGAGSVTPLHHDDGSYTAEI
jgi:hypothetical protein